MKKSTIFLKDICIGLKCPHWVINLEEAGPKEYWCEKIRVWCVNELVMYKVMLKNCPNHDKLEVIKDLIEL